MSKSAMLEQLLLVLQEHQIPLTQDDVQWAFESVKTKQEVTDWVGEYLNSPTLLTKDELDLKSVNQANRDVLLISPSRYEAICRNTRKDPSLESLQGVRPVHDADLHTAISSLERSTAAIEKQRKALETQKEALLSLKGRDHDIDTQIKLSIQERCRRYAQESSQLNLAIEDAVASITEQITTTKRQTKAVASVLGTSASERLAKDDRALAALEGLMPKILSVQADQSPTKSIEQWCRALVAFRTSEMRARIKCSYHEGLRDYGGDGSVVVSSNESVAEKSVLQDELDTLDSEIASVAEMVVMQELRRPILGSLDRSRKYRQDLQEKWVDYLLSTLEYMALRLSTMGEHAQGIFALSEAISRISEALNATIRDESAQNASYPLKYSSKTESPTKSKSMGLGAMADSDMSEAAIQLLQHLDIFSIGNKKQILNSLSTTSVERQQRLRAQHEAATLSTLHNLGETFGRSDADVQNIMESMYSKTEYKTIQLSDRTLDARLQNLEASIGEVGRQMASLDLGLGPEDTAKRDAFVQKWRNQ